MKNFRFLALLIMISVIGISLNAQTKFMSKLNEQLPIDQNYKIGKLDNGLTYYLRENHKPENRAEIQIVIRAGAIQEEDNQKGLAHFIEHMCFNGTKDFPKDQLVKFLESTGVRFGADLNANTGFDRTYYMITIPLDKPGLLDKGMLVLKDWLSEVSFDSDEIDKERGVIVEEWRLRSNAQSRIFEKHFPYYAYGTKFFERMPIGDTLIIRKAPRERFTTFYKDYYRPNISAVIMVGDFKIADVEPKIKSLFSSIKNPANPKPIEEVSLPIHKETFVSIAKDKEMPFMHVSMMFKHPFVKEGLTYGAYRSHIVNSLLNQMLAQRLSELVKKSDPPYQNASADYSKFFVGGNYTFSVDVMPKDNNFEKGFSAALTEAFRAQQHGFLTSELDRAKTEYLKYFEQAFNEKDKTESRNYAMECYRHFHENESMPGIEHEFEMVKDFIPTITIAEINKLMAGLVTEDGIVISVSAPDKPEVKVPTEKEVLALYNKIKTSKIEAYKDAATDKPLMAKKPTPGKIVDMKKVQGIDIVDMKLSNGARVILKPTTFKNDQILMRAISYGGTSLVDDKDYMSSQLAASIVDESGIAEFDAVTLEKMLTGKTANVSPMISGLSEGLNGMCVPNDAETMFQLLNLYFTSPRKDPDAFKSFMAKFTDQIKNMRSNPESAFRDSVNAIMGSYHPRTKAWTDDAMASVNYDKAFDIYKQRFADGGDFTYIFVGNIDLEKFKPLIETYIASLPTMNKPENFKDLGIRTPKTAMKKEVKKGLEPKTTVRLSINGKFNYNREDNFNLYAMGEALSIRLREVIREDKSGVYGIGARASVSQYPENDYSISVSFSCAPDRAQELISAVKDVMKDFRDKPVDDTYVQKVKEILTREDEVNFKENNWWMNQLYSFVYNKQDLNNIINRKELINKFTPEIVKTYADKYLNIDKMVEITLIPE